MSFWFGDGFDCYTAIADMDDGYWDSISNVVNFGITTGRFAGSRGINSTAGNLIKNSTVTTDPVHHFSLAIQQNAAITGASAGFFFDLSDGGTGQCGFFFRSDGALILASGTHGGTQLATYTGALTAANTWYQFEIEIIISSTAGGMRVRKNGNVTNDYDSFVSVGNLNTRPGANTQANRVTIGGAASQVIDDFLWRSDASTVPWVGDIRCYTRMPAADSAVAWSRSGAGTVTQSISSLTTSNTIGNGQLRMAAYTIAYSGTIGSVTIVTNSGGGGNLKCAIWADNAGVPGAVLSSTPAQTAVAAGNNIFPISPPLAVTPGQRIWIGAVGDASTTGTWSCGPSGPNGGTAAMAYATFPQPSPVITTPALPPLSVITFNLSGNWGQVAEPQQDGATTYVYSSTVGQSDLYTLQPIGSTPAGVLAVTTRGYVQKSDAGTRLAAVQLQSGATNAQATPLALPAGSWAWNWRTDLTDPATGAAWTPTAVNNALVGVIVTT